MSTAFAPPRFSSHATIAPPEPSAMTRGKNDVEPVDRAMPLAGQPDARAPVLDTCCAVGTPGPSAPVTKYAPPAPSYVIELKGPTPIGAPFTGHVGSTVPSAS